jgi:hypothetical protein
MLEREIESYNADGMIQLEHAAQCMREAAQHDLNKLITATQG